MYIKSKRNAYLALENLRNFVGQDCMNSHAYSVGCVIHIFPTWFSQDLLTETWCFSSTLLCTNLKPYRNWEAGDKTMKINRLLILALFSITLSSCKWLPEVETSPVADIMATSAKCGGNVTNEGDGSVTARGVCWSTSPNPTLFDNYTNDGSGPGEFVSQLKNLTTGIKYYVRAYATNDIGTSYGKVVDFIPHHQQLGVDFNEITEITAISAKCSATVTGDDGLELTSKGFCWNTSGNPTISDTFTDEGIKLEAYNSVIVPLESNTKYYVRPYVQNANGISYGEQIEFTTKVLSEGAAKGLFSISETEQVYFSKGNLQYQASTGTWRFAENQWNFVGGIHEDWSGTTESGNVYQNGVKCNNNEISSSYDGWIDLFGWGTSGWNNGNMFYQPYDYYTDSIEANHGFGYGPTQNNSFNFDITGDNAKADWGVHNAITNGGNQPGIWRTLTKDEFWYLFYNRKDASNKRAKATVCGVYGIIFLPDYCVLPDGLEFNPISYNYTINTYGVSEWEAMENAGAVFLPSAGSRDGKNINVSAEGWYWSSNYYNANHAWNIYFSGSSVNLNDNRNRYYGFSVRLVQDR